MSTIYLTTVIKSDIHKVFDLARDIDLHQKSTSKTNEKAVAGRTSGLIELNETVTWRAKHLGFYQTHQSKITEMEKPYQFIDVMLKGRFKSFKHQHVFKTEGKNTVMTDILEFESPYGIIGKIFNKIFLKNYMKNFLLERNKLIKVMAEK
ncbi:SRPBCC family protein [Chryseobacterium sp. Ch-15]|uniref:SRPBCC family protein n=1 Tax=Chryseobacterium muglaense TaxID=2893752 RepID=A0A9Q3V0G8_9FLAO|nr:SRPBCC family protein [Chryseobacterium muglaense]MBD3906871.1 SRPBCC family protein [Chryseobacterium muglaense]MCC9036719.1 SRPBCC family protein [Chryseobacterium muglaense]MCM2555328.1 SRPBCC family protein [Chryseobacterium muglaense]